MNPHPIVVDLFAGGGGASMGIEQALGRPVDHAINHDPEAVAMHTANHPGTRHWTQDVWKVDPLKVANGSPVALAWFSPDCTHFSKAKGGQPRRKTIRDLAWVVVEWAKAVRPSVIMLENVEEFRTWGPLDEEGFPIKAQSGETFQQWASELRDLGYQVEWRELRACDYGAPTIRKRLFVIARCDGKAIRWPLPSHGKGMGQAPWRTAAECIDWALPCPSIFDRRKPLAEATMRRIATGIRRYVIEAEQPFIVSLTHQGGERVHGVDRPFNTITGAHRGELAYVAPYVARIGQTGGNGDYVNDVRAPLTTVVSKAEHLLLAPTLVQTGYGEREGQAPRALDLDKPLGTVVSGGKHALVSAFLAKHFGGVVGVPATQPMPTILSKAAQTQVVTSNLLKLYGTNDAAPVDAPLPTVTAGGGHIAEVRAFLMHYYSGGGQTQGIDTPMHVITARDRVALGIVHISGQAYVITDIGMRMLVPHELFAAQGFPPGYVIAPMVNEKPLTKTAQVRMCGNSVPPQFAEALVRANVVFPHQSNLWRGYELAAAGSAVL